MANLITNILTICHVVKEILCDYIGTQTIHLQTLLISPRFLSHWGPGAPTSK